MACGSCGSSRPMTPVVRDGFPTVWSWLLPSADLEPVPTEDAIPLLELLNGPL